MLALKSTDRTSLVKHIKNIYKSGELLEDATCAKFAQVQNAGSRKIRREVTHYNLDLIISVGYRFNSKQEIEIFTSVEVYVPTVSKSVGPEFEPQRGHFLKKPFYVSRMAFLLQRAVCYLF